MLTQMLPRRVTRPACHQLIAQFLTKPEARYKQPKSSTHRFHFPILSRQHYFWRFFTQIEQMQRG
jgi:hypothetical protein